MSILKNLSKIRSEASHKVKIVAVVASHSVREINQALFLDVKDVAEIIVSEAKKKKAKIKYPVNWHFVGTLKKSDVKDAVETFNLIQTVDSLDIAKTIDKQCWRSKKNMSILIRVNILGYKNVQGVKKDQLIMFLKQLSGLKNLSVLGLMCSISSINMDEANIDKHFKDMNKLFRSVKKEKIQGIKMKYLSMGTSQDYPLALKNSSNMLLLDKAIFDKKKR
ncbi:MAG: YggS family pyridoxal phosphate-dependent enzyme [Nanoarchaeota archaeon]|nr:YggS family pyridoxal phosphate-dependent enzyme [Nanoarchaeota archaeon]MBU1269201.1 YggS family pyridoxal phosphate-dependent enzyme [Nanoarchaeota archaeon]MBU1605039.1 YggS family pyridoxal phosphate-dependent enzyme [Nanoarchaeota archaeon]MBU2442876.1 YggS family pyridoxal phosphate-dependent enzyme [Nanoarchaeota archaeon]